MKDLLEKLCTISGEILYYSSKVVWASHPMFGEDVIILKFKDINNNELSIEIPHRDIIKLHDHSLENYIFKIASEKGLL